MTTWTYISTDLPGAPIATHTLHHSERPTMKVTLRVERTVSNTVRPDRVHVRATFVGFTEHHGRAEAARLYAQVQDTIGDLKSSDPLELASVDLIDNVVEVSGPDALYAVWPFFDADGTLADTIGVFS